MTRFSSLSPAVTPDKPGSSGVIRGQPCSDQITVPDRLLVTVCRRDGEPFIGLYLFPLHASAVGVEHAEIMPGLGKALFGGFALVKPRL